MSEIDKLIEQAKEGKSILQNMIGNYCYYLVHIFDEFWLEKYEYNYQNDSYKLKDVTCMDEQTARFSLTAMYGSIEE